MFIHGGGEPPSKFYLNYGKTNSTGSLQWLITDSAYSQRTGYDIAALNSNFFVSGEFRDSISLAHDFTDIGVQHEFLAAMNMEETTTIDEHSNTPLIADYALFPNPSSGRFTLQLGVNFQKSIRHGDMIYIFDQMGNCILRQQFSGSSAELIDLSKIAKGIYIVEVETEKERVDKKIVLN